MRLLTPPGAGGIAVLALEGADRDRSAALLRWRGRPLDLTGQQAPRLASLEVGGTTVDQVLVIPRPTLGRLELHVHGSEAVLEACRRALGLAVRSAGPAEHLLRHALSEAQLSLALEQLELDFETFLRGLPGLPPRERREAAGRALERSRPARALAEPQKLVLCGAQNAGKSTLMNRLLVRERALVGDRPGLTRDPVRELTCLDGYPYELVDTAGLGVSASALDVAAQQRGRAERRLALRILVVDGARGPGPADAGLVDQRTLVVCNKVDLPQAPWRAPFPPDARISCVGSLGWTGLRQKLGQLLSRHRGLPAAGPAGGVAALDAGQEAALRRILEGATLG